MIDIITCDVDGILNDLEAFQHWMVKDYFTKKGKSVPEIQNPEGYDISEIYGITKKRRNIIWLQYFKQYCLEHEPRKGAFEVLKHWQDANKKISLVTARAFATNKLLGPLARSWYLEWQEMFDFIPNDIIWCPEKDSGPAKAEACKELNSKLMIEDKPDNFEYTLEVCPNIAIINSHNQKYVPKNKKFELYKVHNWFEIKQTVDNLDQRRLR